MAHTISSHSSLGVRQHKQDWWLASVFSPNPREAWGFLGEDERDRERRKIEKRMQEEEVEGTEQIEGERRESKEMGRQRLEGIRGIQQKSAIVWSSIPNVLEKWRSRWRRSIQISFPWSANKWPWKLGYFERNNSRLFWLNAYHHTWKGTSETDFCTCSENLHKNKRSWVALVIRVTTL